MAWTVAVLCSRAAWAMRACAWLQALALQAAPPRCPSHSTERCAAPTHPPKPTWMVLTTRPTSPVVMSQQMICPSAPPVTSSVPLARSAMARTPWSTSCPSWMLGAGTPGPWASITWHRRLGGLGVRCSVGVGSRERAGGGGGKEKGGGGHDWCGSSGGRHSGYVRCAQSWQERAAFACLLIPPCRLQDGSTCCCRPPPPFLPPLHHSPPLAPPCLAPSNQTSLPR